MNNNAYGQAAAFHPSQVAAHERLKRAAAMRDDTPLPSGNLSGGQVLGNAMLIANNRVADLVERAQETNTMMADFLIRLGGPQLLASAEIPSAPQADGVLEGSMNQLDTLLTRLERLQMEIGAKTAKLCNIA